MLNGVRDMEDWKNYFRYAGNVLLQLSIATFFAGVYASAFTFFASFVFGFDYHGKYLWQTQEFAFVLGVFFVLLWPGYNDRISGSTNE